MKTKKLFFLSLLTVALFLISCTKEDDITLDKQIRIGFGGMSYGSWVVTGDTSWILIDNSDFVLTNFDKRNYSDLKSIYFSAAISSKYLTNYCNVELFSLTDSVSISNSIISSNQPGNEMNAKYLNSDNILNSLPNKKIDIAVRIKSSIKDNNYDNSQLMSSMYLFLER